MMELNIYNAYIYAEKYYNQKLVGESCKNIL